MTEMRKAYWILDVKSVGEADEDFVIRGMATTPDVDRMNDIVDPLGASYADDIPLLWMHDHSKPVGRVQLSAATKKGIPFVARIPNVKEDGILRERVQEAVQSIRYRLVAAVSIGFRVLDDAVEHIENYGLRFMKTEIIELSLVTVPANPQAVITGVKSIDSQLLAVSGQKQRRFVRLLKASPGVSGKAAVTRGPVQLIPRKSSDEENHC